MLEQFIRSRPRLLYWASILYRWLQPWRLHPLWAFPHYLKLLRDWARYRRLGGQADLVDFYPCLFDRTRATSTDPHYFYQAAWAMRCIHETQPGQHVDIGSDVRYVGMLSQVVPVTFVDIRPLTLQLSGLDCRVGTVLDLPYPMNSVQSMSCLHVIEHVGLGRYGDPLDPQGSRKAALELSRVLAPGGRLYVSVPVGRERVCYNAHRVFAPQPFSELFVGLRLLAFSWVSDAGQWCDAADMNVNMMQAAPSDYGCGLFIFEKPLTRVSS